MQGNRVFQKQFNNVSHMMKASFYSCNTFKFHNLVNVIVNSAVTSIKICMPCWKTKHLSEFSKIEMGKLKVFLIAIVVLTQLADAASKSVSDFVNQVIYVETYRYRGRWLDAHHSFSARFTQAPQSKVVDYTWTKWIVRRGPGNTMALESVRYPNHFLDAHHSGSCRVTYTPYPYNKNWALWYLEYSHGRYAFRSTRYSKSRLDAHHSHDARVTKGRGIWSQMRIYQPNISERKALIFVYDNSKGTTPVHTSYTEKIGVSRTDTHSSSYTVGAEIGVEIKSIFSAKMSFSATWEQSTSTTWSKETSRTVKVTVNPGTIKKIYQLQGSYGPYKIASNHLFFVG